MKVVKQVRGTTSQNDSFVGEEAQFTVDTTRDEVRLHDGVKPGGHRILNHEQNKLLFMLKDSEFGEVAFGDEDVGILVRVGDRQYELREIEAAADGGITVTNGDGVAGNPTIAIDDDWLTARLNDVVAGGIRFHLTTGTADALEIELDVDGDGDVDATTLWPGQNVNGTLLGIELHINCNDNVSLSINAQAGIEIRLPGDNANVSETFKLGIQLILMKVDTYWIAIGCQTAESIPITPIVGLTATNVQAALAELLGKIPAPIGGEGEFAVGFIWQFDAPEAFQGSLTDRTTALTHGQAFLIASGVDRMFVPTVNSGGDANQPSTVVYSVEAVVFCLGTVKYIGPLIKVTGNPVYAAASNPPTVPTVNKIYTIPPVSQIFDGVIATTPGLPNFFNGTVTPTTDPITIAEP